MSELAYAIIGLMLTVYVVLDGYDLGVGVIAPFVARTAEERRTVMESIGPFWSGNEVWLIAAGGALFAFFPLAYAASFSAFYLPFMVVLWLLMLRGVSLELRNHNESELWHSFWDFCFTGSSALLLLLYGVALGNLLRGLPLDSHGYFRGTFAFLLNPYAVSVGLFAVVLLAQHGALFLGVRVDGPISDRSRALVRCSWWAVLGLFIGTTIATLMQRWQLSGHGIVVWLGIVPVVSLAALVAIRMFGGRGAAWPAFAASTTLVVSVVLAAAATMFPYIVPKYPFGSGGLRVTDAVPSPAALATIIAIAIVGLAIVCAYRIYIGRRLGGKIAVD